ncbi:hypothetical protein VV02_02860 [Luteipulveratus mongoliensis]|uniref:TrbL/VirB6 plasmid conjugal transfer protein n=2 Tax=Luteipulveratus mongoliensis TaxID=571913 RepID=A0A0K1JEB2_9MICO|nr:hypothetical protein VV02_02860 [Luteipulveratus mongoliensis]
MQTPDAVPSICITFGGCAKEAANSAFEAFVKALGAGAVAVMKFLATFWLRVPDPKIAEHPAGVWSGAGDITKVQNLMAPYTATFAVIGFLAGLARIVIAQRPSEARELVRMIALLMAATTAVGAVTQLLLDAGNAYCPYILNGATDSTSKDGGEAMTKIIALTMANGNPQAALGMWLIIYILVILGAMMQVIFMILRGAVIQGLLVFVPFLAAGTASQEGYARFKRSIALLVAFVMYKPVAATIYALGFALLKNAPQSGGGDKSVMTAMYGLVLVIIASLALPALIKFVMPMASGGSSSIFSGGAAVGMIAAGAAIVATAGGGGAAMGAAKAGGSATGAASAGAGGGGGGGGGSLASGAAGGSGGGSGGGGSSPPTGGGAADGESTAAAGTGSSSKAKAGESFGSSGDLSKSADQQNVPSTPSAAGLNPVGGPKSSGGQAGAKTSGTSRSSAGSTPMGSSASSESGGSSPAGAGSKGTRRPSGPQVAGVVGRTSSRMRREADELADSADDVDAPEGASGFLD